MAGNPIVQCPTCERRITNNAIGAHVRTHNSAYREQQRLERNARQRAYRQTEEGKATETRARQSTAGRAGHPPRIPCPECGGDGRQKPRDR